MGRPSRLTRSCVALLAASVLTSCGSSGANGLTERQIHHASNQRLVDLVFQLALNVESRYSDGRTPLEGANEAFRSVFLAEEVNYEWGNGGLLQYFVNTDGAYATEAVRALRRIGAARQAAVLETAITRFAGEKTRLRSQWKRGIKGINESYATSRIPELDGQWVDSTDIEASFIRAHPRQFVDPSRPG